MCSANSQLSVQLEIICLHAAPFSSVSPEQIQIFKIEKKLKVKNGILIEFNTVIRSLLQHF